MLASVRCRGFSGLRGDRSIAFRSTITEELPDFTNFRDHVQVKVGDHHFVLIPAGLGDNFAARIAEVALAVELPNAPWLFDAHAVDSAHKIAIGYSVRRLFEFPQIFRETGYGGRRIEYDFGSIQSQNAGALGKMTIVANVNSDPRIFGFEDWISKIAWGEEELLPESGMAVRNVVLAIFPQIAAIGIDHGGSIEIHSRHLLFVYGNNHHHAMFGGDLLHHVHRGTVRHSLGKFIPASVLLGTKIRTVKKLLQAQDLRFLSRRLLDQLQMLVDHRFSDLGERTLCVGRIAGLIQHTANNSTHGNWP